MADPARSGAVQAAADRLLDHAVVRLLDHLSAPRDGGRWPFSPLVFLSAAEDAATAAVMAAAAVRNLAWVEADRRLSTGRTLDREIAAALADDRSDRLTASLAGCRLVIVDRIDRVADVERQRMLVHLLDASMRAGTAWVVSMPVHPESCFEPPLASRLGGGLVVRLAANPSPSVAHGGAAPSVGRIIRAAAGLHDVPPSAVVGPSRRRTVAAARSLAMYLARRLTGRSYEAIGAACGGRDHTTVLHGVRVCGSRLARDPAFAADVERIAAGLAGHGTGSPATSRRRHAVGSPPRTRTRGDRRRSRRRTA